MGAPRNRPLALECSVEAYPPPITYWLHGDRMILNGNETEENHINEKTRMYIYKKQFVINILPIIDEDFDDYHCVAKNSLGKGEASIRVYGKLK